MQTVQWLHDRKRPPLRGDISDSSAADVVVYSRVLDINLYY